MIPTRVRVCYFMIKATFSLRWFSHVNDISGIHGGGANRGGGSGAEPLRLVHRCGSLLNSQSTLILKNGLDPLHRCLIRSVLRLFKAIQSLRADAGLLGEFLLEVARANFAG